MERIQYAVFPAMQSPSPRANRVMDTLGERETIRSGVMALRMIAKFGNPAMAGAASGSENVVQIRVFNHSRSTIAGCSQNYQCGIDSGPDTVTIIL